MRPLPALRLAPAVSPLSGPLLSGLLLAALALPIPSAATTRYVAVDGDDSWSNPGTSISAPLATLNRACWASVAGDEVLVRGGVYFQRVSLSCNGTAQAPIRFAPYPGEVAVIDGSQSAPDQTLVGVYGQYIHFTGFEVRHATRTCISGWGVAGLRLAGNTIHHCELGGVWIGHDQPFANTDVTVEDNTVHTTATRFYPHTTTSGWPSAISVGATTGGLVRGNRVHGNHGEGIGIGHSRFVDVIGNDVRDNYSTNIYLDNMQDAVVAGNFVHTRGDPVFFRYDGPANGISVANEHSEHEFQESERIQILNNVVTGARYGLYYGNFQFGTGLHDSLIAHNTVHAAFVAGLRIDDAPHTNTRITQNIVVQAPAAVLAAVAGPGLTFERNGWWGGTPPAAAQHAADVQADPRFVAATPMAAADFRLQAASAMAQSGALLAQVGADFDGAARNAPTSLGAFEAAPAPVVTMGVASVAIGHGYSNRRHHYAASVRVFDSSSAWVAGATVTGRWTGALSGTYSAVTGNDGIAVMPSVSTKSGNAVTFTVTGVVKTGVSHDTALDVQTSATFDP